MSVAIRKRSWEEHVTHSSGLQYSYDDLDLVCCHGVDRGASWVGSRVSKQGQRARCASMPECCHQPSTDIICQASKVMTSVVHNNDSEHMNSVESNGTISHISCTVGRSAHCENPEGVVGAVNSQSQNIGNGNNALKSEHICGTLQQCISISLNNGPPLSECAGEQPGKHPNHLGTKERQREGYSRPPDFSGPTLNHSSAAETLLPDVEDKISTTGHQDASATFPVSETQYSVNMMENGDVMSNTVKNVDPTLPLVAEGDSADKPNGNGLNYLNLLNGNTNLNHHSSDIKEGDQNHECTGCQKQIPFSEIAEDKLFVAHDVEMAAINQGEERAKPESEEAADVECGMTPSDRCSDGQCCTASLNDVSTKQLDVGIVKGDPTQIGTNTTENTQQALGPNPSINAASENMNGSSLCFCEDHIIPHHLRLENSSSKLDIILEVSLSEADDKPVLGPENNISVTVTHCPVAQHSHTSEEQTHTKQPTGCRASCCTEVSDVLLLEGLHGNQASACCCNESPASVVADGQRECHRPGATLWRMDETDSAAQTVIYSDTQFINPDLDGMDEPGYQEDDKKKKMCHRKTEHTRLDSMVLLLMKLDQLDKEIETALNATSSKDSTPTIQHRQPLEFEFGSETTALQDTNRPHPQYVSAIMDPTLDLGPPPTLQAKHQSGEHLLCRQPNFH